jgi:hypothetical protein
MNGLLALTLFGSTILFWLSAIFFLIMCFVAESKENGFIATGTLIVVALLYHFWGDIKPILMFLTVLNVSIYLAIGFGLATVRTFVEGRKLKMRIKNLPIDAKEGAKLQDKPLYGNEKTREYYGDTQESEIKSFKEELSGNVSRWFLMWPISMTNWMLRNIVREVWDFVYSKLKNFFNYVLELGMKSVS